MLSRLEMDKNSFLPQLFFCRRNILTFSVPFYTLLHAYMGSLLHVHTLLHSYVLKQLVECCPNKQSFASLRAIFVLGTLPAGLANVRSLDIANNAGVTNISYHTLPITNTNMYKKLYFVVRPFALTWY